MLLCGKQRTISSTVSQLPPALFHETGSPTFLELAQQARRVGERASGIHLSLLPQHWDYETSTNHHTGLFLLFFLPFMWVLGIESRSCAREASTLLTALSPQFPFCFKRKLQSAECSSVGEHLPSVKEVWISVTELEKQNNKIQLKGSPIPYLHTTRLLGFGGTGFTGYSDHQSVHVYSLL